MIDILNTTVGKISRTELSQTLVLRELGIADLKVKTTRISEILK